MSNIKLYPGARVRAENGVEGTAEISPEYNQPRPLDHYEYRINYADGVIYYCKEDGTRSHYVPMCPAAYRPVEMIEPETTTTTLLDRIAELERRVVALENARIYDAVPIPSSLTEQPITLSPDVWAIVESPEYPEGVLCEVHERGNKWFLTIHKPVTNPAIEGWEFYTNGMTVSVQCERANVRVVRTVPKWRGRE